MQFNPVGISVGGHFSTRLCMRAAATGLRWQLLSRTTPNLLHTLTLAVFGTKYRQGLPALARDSRYAQQQKPATIATKNSGSARQTSKHAHALAFTGVIALAMHINRHRQWAGRCVEISLRN